MMSCIKKLKNEPGLDWVDKVPVPQIGPTDCLIEVTHAGICGTDRHIYEWDAWASSRVPVGVTCGHEFVGRIVAVGDACKHRKVGERVSAEGHIGCGECPACRQGDMHICYSVDILGIDCDGCFAQYVAVPEYNCWPVPEAIPDKVAAIFDPLGNAMHTVMAAGVSGQNVLITGAGIIGLMAVSIAKHAGAGRTYVTDIDPRRLKIAKDLGADEAFSGTDAEWVQKCRKATKGHGVDVLLEMSGNPTAIQQGFKALRAGGRASLLGIPTESVPLDLVNDVIFKGATVQGIYGRRMYETWVQMTALLKADRLNLEPLFGERVKLEQFEDAFAKLQGGLAGKILLYPNGMPQ